MEKTGKFSESTFLLKLDGKMTYEFYRALEDLILETMRHHKNLAIDLSEVKEVDLCGLHLLSLLQGKGVIVATSPVVEQMSERLITTLHAAALGRSRSSRCLTETSTSESSRGNRASANAGISSAGRSPLRFQLRVEPDVADNECSNQGLSYEASAR